MRRLLLCAVASLALAGTAHGQDVKKIQSEAPNDVATATDVVFVAEGYTAADEAGFFADARAAAHHVADDPNGAPYRSVRKWNFHYVFVSSNQKGAPWEPGAAPRDTACKAHLRADQFLEVDDGAAETAAVALAPDVDVVVVLIKFAEKAPFFVRANADVKLGPRGRVRLPSTSGNALVHELGHALFGLGDEYVERDETIPEDRKPEIAIHSNLSCDGTGARWKAITTSVVEGGAGWAKGVWKCQPTCVMNDHTGPTFCPVCLNAITHSNDPKPAKTTPALAGGGTKRTTEDPIVLSWNPSSATTVRYWTTLSYLKPGGNSYDPVWWGGVEGQFTEKRLGGLPAGKYAFYVRAEGISGSSEGQWLEFEVTKSPSGIVREPLVFMAPGVVVGSEKPFVAQSRGIAPAIQVQRKR